MSESPFDTLAAAWDEKPARRKLTASIAAGIVAAVPLAPVMHAWDYGCGTGNLSLHLAEHVGSIHATDASRGMVEQLQAKLQTTPELQQIITAAQLDLCSQPGPAERFDLICTAMVLHHIEQAETVVTRFVDHLAPGGWCAIADLCQEDGSFHQDMVVPHNGFCTDTLGRLLQNHGVKIQSLQTVHTITRPSETEGSSEDMEYPIFLLVGQKQ